MLHDYACDHRYAYRLSIGPLRRGRRAGPGSGMQEFRDPARRVPIVALRPVG